VYTLVAFATCSLTFHLDHAVRSLSFGLIQAFRSLRRALRWLEWFDWPLRNSPKKSRPWLKSNREAM